MRTLIASTQSAPPPTTFQCEFLTEMDHLSPIKGYAALVWLVTIATPAVGSVAPNTAVVRSTRPSARVPALRTVSQNMDS